MTQNQMTCPLCGFQYDPKDHPHCLACPLKRDCQMVCCPACQYTTIDPNQSKLAKFASRFLSQDNTGETVSTRK